MPRPPDSGRLDLAEVFYSVQEELLAQLAVGGFFEHPSAAGAATERHWLDVLARIFLSVTPWPRLRNRLGRNPGEETQGQPACFPENSRPLQQPSTMPRMPRAVLTGVPHHLTQRGLDRRQVFFGDTDYEVYLALVRCAALRFGADLLGYCLMPNHVHWIVSPQQPASLARAFGEAHGRYASYANAKFSRSGHFWQNRFFSCGLDQSRLWTALRYVERNPVRAGLADEASGYRWSSASAHCGYAPHQVWLEAEPMSSSFSPDQWAAFLKSDTMEAETELRISTHTGRPAGSQAFVAWAESN